MLGLFSMLLNIAFSQYIEIFFFDYDSENIAYALVVVADSDDNLWLESDVEIRPYHDGECTFFTSSIMETTSLGMAIFEFICTCPDYDPCTVILVAENFMERYMYLNNYFGDNFIINRKIDKTSVKVGSSFNLIADYVDENENKLESLIIIDDYLGEYITYTTIADQINGHAEFNVTFYTTGPKILRVISNYIINSYENGDMAMHQIAISQISINDYKIINLILNNNDESKQTILIDEPFIVTLQAYELGTTIVDIQVQSSVQLAISSSESEDITFSKTFTNGVAVFDNLIVVNYGSYDIVAVSDGFNNAVVSKIVTGYLRTHFNNGIVNFI